MTVPYALEAFTVAIERARAFAIAANLGEHALSELDHLTATANANKQFANLPTTTANAKETL